MSKPSLLLVDKDPKSRRVLEVSLRKAGYDVLLASNSAEAQALLSQKSFDAVISDLSQEGPESIALLTKNRSSSSGTPTPFVFLTREGQVDEKKRALEAGAAELIDRPIYAKEFLARIKLLLQKQTRTRMEGSADQGNFSGSLSDLGVVDLLQTIERGHKTGVVSIESDSRRGEIYFRNGRVIDASLGRLQGEDAVYRMFLWADGAYFGEFKNVRHEERIKLSSQGLVLEGMRRLEEWTRLLDGLPPVQHICEVDYPALAERLGELPDEVNAILRLFDGHRSLLQVIDDADFGPIETLTILGKLYAEGILYDTVQKPTRAKGAIPSLELERWLSGLPPILEPAKETNALPEEIAPRDGLLETNESPAVQPVALQSEPGLSVQSRTPLAQEEPAAVGERPNIPNPLPEVKAPEITPLPVPEPIRAEAPKPSPTPAPIIEPVKVEPIAEAPKPEPIKVEAPRPEPVKVAPKAEVKAPEEKKAPPKREDNDDDDDRPRPKSLSTPIEPKDDDDDDDILPTNKSNNTLYYALAAAALVVIALFAFGGGSEKTKATPASTTAPTDPDNTPDTEPAASLPASDPFSQPVSTSAPTSTSNPSSQTLPAETMPAFPVVLTPEQKKQYDDLLDKAGTLYKEEKYDAAIAQFREALKVDPYGPDALYGVGNTLYDKGYFAFSDEDPKKTKEQRLATATPLFEESIKTLALAVEKHPNNAKLQITLAFVSEYRSKEENKELTKTLVEDRQRAKAAYEAYLKIEPSGDYANDARDGIAMLKKLLP